MCLVAAPVLPNKPAITFALRKAARVWAAGGRAAALLLGAALAGRLQCASFAAALEKLLAYSGRLPTVCWLLRWATPRPAFALSRRHMARRPELSSGTGCACLACSSTFLAALSQLSSVSCNILADAHLVGSSAGELRAHGQSASWGAQLPLLGRRPWVGGGKRRLSCPPPPEV